MDTYGGDPVPIELTETEKKYAQEWRDTGFKQVAESMASKEEFEKLLPKRELSLKEKATNLGEKTKGVIEDFKHEITYTFKFHKYVRALIIVMAIIIVILLLIIVVMGASGPAKSSEMYTEL